MALSLLGGCGGGPPSADKVKLVVWGLEYGEENKGLQARVDEFQKRHPEIEVSVLSMGAGSMNPQKLMTAIVGNVPPDVIHQDRFTIGDWAARDTFLPLDTYIARDRDKPYGVREEDYYPACWKEANYTDPITGRHGIFADPVRHRRPRAVLQQDALQSRPGSWTRRARRSRRETWDELLDDTQEADDQQSRRHLQTIGFIPNYGNSWLYIYAWQNDGEFMSPDGRTCTMNAPDNVEALDYMVKVYDALGGVDQGQTRISPDSRPTNSIRF